MIVYCHSYDKKKCKDAACVFLENKGSFKYGERTFFTFVTGPHCVEQIDKDTIIVNCIGKREAIFSKSSKLEYEMRRVIREKENKEKGNG